MTVRVRAALIFILLLAVAAPAFAQSNVGGGVKVGVNFATVSGTIDSDVSKSIRTGAAVGAFASVTLTDHVAFEPEVLYSMEGVKVEFDDSGTTFKSTAKVDVIQIPFLFRIGAASGGSTGGYFVVGPGVGIIARAKQTDPTGGPDVDIKDELKSTYVSVVVGAGVNIRQFLIEGRYSAGLTDVNKEDTGEKNKSQVFSVLFGVRF